MTTAPVLDTPSFHRRGFALLKRVFSPEEIAGLRRAALAAAGVAADETARDAPRFLLERDLLSEPRLRHLVLDPRIVSIARQAVGGTPAYFGMTKLMVQWQRDWTPFHRDNVDAMLDDPRGPDWSSDYSLVRLGLYLQDHSRHGGSLWIREASHVGPRARGRPCPLANELGDVGVWSLRATHGVRPWPADPLGISPRLPDLPAAVLHRALRPLTPPAYKYWPRPRIFIHLVFGRDDAHLAHFMHHVPRLDKLAWVHTQWRNASHDQDTVRLAAERGMRIVMPAR
jgi:hypothetical protein